MTRNYYAVFHPYGVRTLNTWRKRRDPGGGGNQADILCVYPSKQTRDADAESMPDRLLPVTYAELRGTTLDPRRDHVLDYAWVYPGIAQ